MRISSSHCILMISYSYPCFFFFFFFNDTATTEIYTLSLHDALPILAPARSWWRAPSTSTPSGPRSEEHTSELQSRRDLVCRLLLEKKKTKKYSTPPTKRKTRRTAIAVTLIPH